MTNIFLGTGELVLVGGVITSLAGIDISGATFLIALGTSPDEPPPSSDPAWVAPTSSVAGSSNAQRIIELQVTAAVATGTYFVWGRIAAPQETRAGLLQSNVNVYN